MALCEALLLSRNIASALDSFSAGDDRESRQRNCLRKSNRKSSSGLMPRCESENKWIVLLFHVATAKVTT